MPASTYGRQVVVPLTNKSGGSVAAGDVVIVDTTNNDAFTTTTSANVTKMIGIAQETIANNATGRILTSGYAALVNVNASVTRGNYGATHTVAKQATDAGTTRVAGTFCQFLTGGTTPDAAVWQPDLGGAGVSVTTKGDLQTYSGSATRLAVGPDGSKLVADSAAATGLAYYGVPPKQFLGNQVTATSGAVTLSSPAQTSIYFAQIGILGNFTITSITQTNVTWTQLKTANNSTNCRVDLWKGVTTGAPGTSVTVTPSASASFSFVVSEWPTGHGLAGTLDNTADATGNTAFQRSGGVTPTAHNAVAFATSVNSNGAITLPTPGGPFHSLNTTSQTFASFGYCWSGKHPVQSYIAFQTSAQWAFTLAAVI